MAPAAYLAYFLSSRHHHIETHPLNVQPNFLIRPSGEKVPLRAGQAASTAATPPPDQLQFNQGLSLGYSGAGPGLSPAQHPPGGSPSPALLSDAQRPHSDQPLPGTWGRQGHKDQTGTEGRATGRPLGQGLRGRRKASAEGAWVWQTHTPQTLHSQPPPANTKAQRGPGPLGTAPGLL